MTEPSTTIIEHKHIMQAAEIPVGGWCSTWQEDKPCEEEPTQWEGIVRCKHCGGMRESKPKPLEKYPPHLYGTHLSNNLHDIIHRGMIDHLTEDDRKELSRKHL